MHVFTFVVLLPEVVLCSLMHVIFDDSHVHATSPPCSRAVAQACPKISLTWPDPIPHRGKGSGTWP